MTTPSPLPLRDAFAHPFPAGTAWATEALARLGRTPTDDAPVRAIVQGWMRLGGERDALLVDTLFVLTDDQLGFGQTHIHTTDPNWIPLSTIVALDLIEGVPYPLEAIEVQFAGGLAIFVGWPEEFSRAVLDTLLGPAEVEIEVDDDSVTEATLLDEDAVDEADDEAAVAEAVADGLLVEDVEPELASDLDDELLDDDVVDEVDAEPDDTPFARTGVPVIPVMPPLFAALDPQAHESVEPAGDDDAPDEGPSPVVPPVAQSPLSRLTAPTTPFAPDDGPGSYLDDSESSELEDRFFSDLEHADEADEAATMFSVTAPDEDDDVPDVPDTAKRERGPWDDPAMPWPDPYRNCVFLGGHPVHQRRRKNVVVVMRAGGLVIAAAGSNSWSIHVPWHEVRRIDVQGADEVKFTHNHRIDLNGSALVIEQVDGTSLIVEVRNRRPATVRSGLAPVIAMANSLGSGGSSGGADLSSF